MDQYLQKLGSPIGAMTYLPLGGSGEDYLHNYLGMCGIPLEGTMTYPTDAKTIFLAEGAAVDSDIIDKMHNSLMDGADVIVTSGRRIPVKEGKVALRLSPGSNYIFAFS